MRNDFYGIGLLVGAMWVIFLVNLVLPIDLNQWGLRPRSFSGLVGIPAMPFLHAGLGHLIGNTIPLVVLLVLLVGSRQRPWMAVATVVLLGGSLLWLFGRPAIHIGASGLVFGLSAFLVVVGFRERHPVALAISVLVAVLYGGTLLVGLIPQWGSSTSWDGHLCGLIAGGIAGSMYSSRNSP
ncbi:MAG: rhomboid family intramembrane serine protease [Rubripirellula sp.]